MSASQAEPSEIEWQEASAIVPGPHGLHARPAIRFARSARGFSARVQVRAANREGWVDGKSLARVISLKIESGGTILLRACGSDAGSALAALQQLVEGELATEVGDPG